MFKIFKKKSQLDRLNDEYAKLMSEAHRLSTSDRKASDRKIAEAQEIAERIQEIMD